MDNRQTDESKYNIGFMTNERIDLCIRELKASIMQNQIGFSIKCIKELLTEIHCMIPEKEKEKVDELVEYMQDNYNPSPRTYKEKELNALCFNNVYEIQKIIKTTLWKIGYTMPKKDSLIGNML